MSFRLFSVFSLLENLKTTLLLGLLLLTAGCMKPSTNDQKSNSQNLQGTNNSIPDGSSRLPTKPDSNLNVTAPTSVIEKPDFASNTGIGLPLPLPSSPEPLPSPAPLPTPLPSLPTPSPLPSLPTPSPLPSLPATLTTPTTSKPMATQLKAQKEFNCLNKYYKNQFNLSADQKYVVFKDGTKLIWDDQRNKTPDELFSQADINDIFHDLYAVGQTSYVPLRDFDPGRYRPQAFFKKLYGSSKAEVSKQLVKVQLWKGEISRSFSNRYGAADALKRVVAKIDKLLKSKPQMKKFLVGHFDSSGNGGIGGTFVFRPVVGSNIWSMHSFGVAIDIIYSQSDYWHNNLTGNTFAPYKNKIPFDIVKIFESEKFIWGGKWFHYDTMHFEYRPELFCMLEAP